jgi:hypothetical protein
MRDHIVWCKTITELLSRLGIGPFLSEFKASPAEYKAGLELAIDRGWPSGTYVKFTQTGAELFA